MENLELQTNTDEIQASSEPTQSEQPETSVAGNESPQETPPKQPESTPFHEHPRFKELVEQKNQALEQSRRLQEQYAQMEAKIAQLSKKPEPQDPLLARLKSIDPEFGERFEKLTATEKELAELRQWRQEMQEQQFVSSAVSKIKDLHSSNKVDANLAARYEKDLDSMYRAGQIRSMEDVEKAYKSIHEEYSALFDTVKRAERESYVVGKKADAKVPTSQPKGKTVPAAKAEAFSSNPSEARAQLVKRILSTAKAESEL